MSNVNNISKGKTGAIGEMLAAVDLTRRGYDVFRAVSQSSTCDLIAVMGSRCIRVEATKGHYMKNGKLAWTPHDKTRYDVLALIIDSQVTYLGEL